MRLFLSSYHTSGHAEELRDLFGENARVAVITNAKDYKTQAERDLSVNEVMMAIGKTALTLEELDLRPYFNKARPIEPVLRSYDAVWAAGGNTFILRRALELSGSADLLKKLVEQDKLAYGGDSAGAILATPDFTGVEYSDDPTVTPKGYSGQVITAGLGLVDYRIVPHYQSEKFGKETEDMVNCLKKKKLPYKTLTNDQAIVINGDREIILG